MPSVLETLGSYVPAAIVRHHSEAALPAPR